MEKLSRTDLLILDDYGVAPLSDHERRDFLEILDDRYGRRATLITSQLPLDHGHDAIGDNTFADAILNRLVYDVHRLTLKKPSMHKEGSIPARAAPRPSAGLTPAARVISLRVDGIVGTCRRHHRNECSASFGTTGRDDRNTQRGVAPLSTTPVTGEPRRSNTHPIPNGFRLRPGA